jgi:hypothetical protein
MKKLLIFIALGLTACSQQPSGLSRTDLYMLADKCHTSAEAFFKKLNSNPLVYDAYQSHYNQKLNKCFIATEIYGETPRDVDHSLYDVNENKIIARMGIKEWSSPWTCRYGDNLNTQCIESESSATIQKYESITKPYMTE